MPRLAQNSKPIALFRSQDPEDLVCYMIPVRSNRSSSFSYFIWIPVTAILQPVHDTHS